MKTEKLRLASAVSILVLGAGCSLGSLKPVGGAASARDVGNRGWWFQTTSNPILKYEELEHYSSDPAVEVVTDPSNGKKTLIMITSTDLEINSSNYPMDGVHLFTTQAENGLIGADWYEHGDVNENRRMDPIFELIDFGVDLNNNDKRMFAPDIQYVQDKNQFFFVPFREKLKVAKIYLVDLEYRHRTRRRGRRGIIRRFED